MDFINYIGYYGPAILILVNIYALSQYPQHLYLYLPFLFINDIIFNPALKLLIKDPRPIGYQKSIGIDNHNIYTNAHIYGMPSGHAQSSFFSNVYLWLVTGSMGYFLSGLFIASITVYQRWRDKRNTIQQLALCAIVGTLFAYGSYYMLSKKILQ